MAFAAFKIIDLGSISAGSTVQDEYTSDDDYILKRIYVVETTETAVGTAFLTGTFRINDVPFTKDEVNLALFEGYRNQVPELDLALGKGSTFFYSVKNNHSSSAISAQLILELHK